MYVSLVISATSIRLLSVKGRQVKKWGSAPLASGLVRDGLILQPKVVGAVIDALFKSTEISKKRVITSLSGLNFTHRLLDLPWMRPALLEEAILRGAKKEIPLPLEELYLSWQAIGIEHDNLDFFVVGVPRNLIDTMVQTLEEAGVEPYIMDLKPLALARAAGRENAIIVDLEPDYFDIVLVANGIPAIMCALTPRGEGATLEDNIQRLADELSKTVNFYNSNHPENPLSPTIPLLLTGELSTNAAAGKLIQALLEYPVDTLVPLLKSPPSLPIALYAANIGLALKKVPCKAVPKGEVTQFRDINLNILSPKLRAEAHPMPMRYIILSLVLIIAAGLLLPMYRLKSQADAATMHLRTELSRVEQELRQARLALNAAEQIEDTIAEIVNDVDTLEQEHRDILGKRGDYANTLTLVTDALPSGAYFTSMEIHTNKVTVEGKADSFFTVISYAMALEAQTGFSEVRIAEIDESNVVEGEEAETTRVSFSIIIHTITKQD